MKKPYFTRRRYAAAMLLLACAMFLPSKALANLAVTVAGVQVDNGQDIHVQAPAGSDVTIEGVWYYASTNTLVLDNATIITHEMGVSAIFAESAGEGNPELTIKLIGESTITSDYIAIYGNNSLSFVNGHVNKSQRPILHVTTTDEFGLLFSAIEMITQPYWPGNNQVIIDDCDIDLQGDGPAIKGWYNYPEGVEGDPHFVNLYLQGNATLRALSTCTAANIGAFQYVNQFQFNGLMQMPRNCGYDFDQMAFVNVNTNTLVYPKEVRIAPHIQFEDQAVKNICVQNWDGNHDGELDCIEARLVTSLNEKFKNKTNITSFNELMYFTGLKDLEDFTFSECSNLETVEMPYNLKTIGSNAFANCNSMNIVTIPRGMEEIMNFAFYHSENLTNVAFESDCQLKRIGWLAFGGCPIDYMILPDRLEYIGQQAFWDNRLRELEIPYSVQEIGDNAFNQVNQTPSFLQKIVFKRYTPPTVGNNAFGATETGYGGYLSPNTTRILVTQYQLNAYKSAIPQYAPYMSERHGYDIYICGVELAEDNLDEDGAFRYSNGNDRVFGVYYNYNNNTLTMREGQIVSNSTTKPAITSYSSGGINIKLEGMNSIYTKNTGISMAGYINISPVSATASSSEKPTLDIQCVKAGVECDNSQMGTFNNIEIKDVALSIGSVEGRCIDGGPYYDEYDEELGYYWQVGEQASVTVENGIINAYSVNGEIIKNVQLFYLKNCRIMRPTAGIFYNGDPVQGTLTWTPISISGHFYIGSWIEFQDPLVEEICVANFDENGDGGIDMLEAAHVTSLGTVFSGTEIEYFDELKYFTCLEEIDDYAFLGCNDLCSIEFPQNTNFWRIGNYAFCNCYQLWAAHNIPSTVTEIGDYAFSGSMMEMIGIPASVVTIGEGAFQGCMGVYFADDAKLETIGACAFAYMSGMSDVEIPASVKTIGESAFVGCGGVRFAEDAQLESIGAFAFYGLYTLPGMLPAKVKYIGKQAFDTGTDEYEYLYMDVQGHAPATIGTYIFGKLSGDSKIFVPAGTVGIYKKAWPEYAKYIVGNQGATDIENVVAESKKRQGVFTLDGRQLRGTADTNGLPAGLYIVNGKKVTVK